MGAPFERDYFDVPSDQNILEYAVRKHLRNLFQKILDPTWGGGVFFNYDKIIS